MSSKVRVLSDVTINQIAAGEVIENPASVVKELLENSLDAGATKIIVEMHGGGLHLIKVSDNGSGMTKDDALLCLERHATSKIREAKDLFHVQTMGFRGEALASIASISKTTLTTSLTDIGTKVEIEGGKIRSVEPCPRKQGTTVEVRNLFFNVPARKKFQKAPALCAGEITRMITVLSLGYPTVSFELYAQDKLVLAAPAKENASFLDSLKQRISQALGASFIPSTFTVDKEEEPFMFQGIIGSPENTRHNRTGQYLFINQRSVQCPLISYAVRDAYGTRIDSDRHPIYVLHLQMPHHLLDVNVHPQKKEVRIRDESLIKDMIQKTLQGALQKTAGAFSSQEEEKIPISFSFKDFSFPKVNTLQSEPSFSAAIQERTQTEAEKKEQKDLPFRAAAFHPLGIFSHYLLIDAVSAKERILLDLEEEPDGLFMVDLAAARARLLFDRLLKSDANTSSKQGLMFPLTYEFSAFEAQSLLSYLDILEKMGFGIRQMGKCSFIIDAIPPFLEEGDMRKILEELLLKNLSPSEEDSEQDSLERKRRRHLAFLASRFARGHKKIFMIQEALTLVEELLKTEAPYQCPQGHKTIVYLSEQHVASFFATKKR